MSVVKLGKKKAKRPYKDSKGNAVVGVTTVCGYGEDSGGLVHAAYQCGIRGENYKEVWSQAAEAGTCGHFLVECHLKGDEADLSEFSPDTVDLATNIFIKFLDYWEQEGLTYIASELEMVSDTRGFGGKLDVVGRDKQGRLCLVDLKSSKAIYQPYLVQISAYEELWNEKEEEKIERRAIFRNGKKEKGDTELRWLPPLPDHFDLFLTQVELWRKWKPLRK